MHRARLLPQWIAENPGTRPFAWWRFVGVPKFGERPIVPDAEMTEADLDAWRLHGILHTSTIPPLQEDETAFLRRHGVLNARASN
jgi:hypothetical protein